MTYIEPRDKKDEEKKHRDAAEEDGDVVFDQTPVRVVCPHCGLSVITFIEHESSWVTYGVSILLLLVLNWAALCVVPVVYPLFKDVVHHCPRCLSVLATRSRVALPSFKQEVMSFRFGSCAIVLARKYVIALMVLSSIIGVFHWGRTNFSESPGVEAVQRGEVSPLGWQDFLKDCGFKSYLGNPIHVTVAFDQRYRNQTFQWRGSVHHVEEALSFLWWSTRGAVFVSMDPPQFPAKRHLPDLALLFESKAASEVRKLKRGTDFSFVASMVEVGRRGSPHIMVLWEAHPGATKSSPGKTPALQDSSAVAPPNSASNGTLPGSASDPDTDSAR